MTLAIPTIDEILDQTFTVDGFYYWVRDEDNKCYAVSRKELRKTLRKARFTGQNPDWPSNVPAYLDDMGFVVKDPPLVVPICVRPGNHHKLEGWWACVCQFSFTEAIHKSMNDPGASCRPQVFVYWPVLAYIEPEKWNSYEFHFNHLAKVKGFPEAIKTDYGPSLQNFRRWLDLIKYFLS
jgi:hypothetical protein